MTTDIVSNVAHQIVGKYLKGNRRKCSLESMRLSEIPFDISVLLECQILSCRNNSIQRLPSKLDLLRNLSELNISFNSLDELPFQIGKLRCLKKLLVQNNRIKNINEVVFTGLIKLETMNLNHNQISQIPNSIGSCRALQKLYCTHNKLQSVPESISQCLKLTELHLGYNKIESIPESIGELFRLTKLILHKNNIEYLPESIADLVSLQVLDIAANHIQVLPSEINDMCLDQFYFESNPLLKLVPVASQQLDEVMPLGELALRVVSKELQNKGSYLHVKIRHYPAALELLDDSGECVLCGCSYRDVWIECVEFVTRSDKLKSIPKSPSKIPIRAAICSHRCFNSKEHNFYGIADLD